MRYTYLSELARLYREFYDCPDHKTLVKLMIQLESAFRPVFRAAGSYLSQTGLVSSKPAEGLRKFIAPAGQARRMTDPTTFLEYKKHAVIAINVGLLEVLTPEELDAVTFPNPHLLPPLETND